MTIYEKNCAALEKQDRYLPILQKLNSLGNKSVDSIKAGVEYIGDRPVLYAENEGRFFQLASMYSDDDQLDRWQAGLNVKYNSNYILFGMGTGMYARRLLSITSKVSIVLVYEPSIEVFKAVIENYDITDILENEKLVFIFPFYETECGLQLVAMLNNLIPLSNVFDTHLLMYPNYPLLFEKYAAELMSKFDQFQQSVLRTSGTKSKYSELFLNNIFKNLHRFYYSKDIFSLTKKIANNATGIVVSSGPSLDKNIELLKKARGKTIIMATDSSVKALLAHDIVPDMFVSVDPGKPLSIFQVPGMENVPIAAPLTIVPGAFEGHENNTFVLHVDPFILKFFKKENIFMDSMSTGGSVAHDCTSLLVFLNVHNIIFVGQDLSYSNDREFAAGTVNETLTYAKEDSVYIDAYGGEGKVRTNSRYVYFRDWFERAIETLKDFTFINATEGGARIAGALEMTLEKALEEYCPVDTDLAMLAENAEELFTPDVKIRYMDYLLSMGDNLVEFKNIIETAIKIFNDMKIIAVKDKVDSKKLAELFKDSDIYYEQISKHPMHFYANLVVQDKAVDQIVAAAINVKEDEKQELINTIDISIKRYSLLLEGTAIIENLYKENAANWKKIRSELGN